MSRRTKRTPRPARCPTLVAMELAPDVGIIEWQSIDAIAAGRATEYHFNVMADVRDLLAIAAVDKRDAEMVKVCDIAAESLLAMKARYLKHGRVGATGDELNILRVMVQVSDDFWKRQSGELFRATNEKLDKARGFERRANTSQGSGI